MVYTIEKNEHNITFTIQRPEVRNAINFEVMDGLDQLIEEVLHHQVGYVVIRGAGEQAFCSGGDLTAFHALHTAEDAFPMLKRMAAILYRISTLPVPVIAFVNGHAVGGGCEIATACDYRFVSNRAKIGFIQGTLAITSGWGGATQLFYKLNQHDQALRFLSEAKLLTATEAQQIGWATEVFDGDATEAFKQFTARMEAMDIAVLRAYKSFAMNTWNLQKMQEQMIEEAKKCAELWESDAHHRAVNAFLSR